MPLRSAIKIKKIVCTLYGKHIRIKTMNKLSNTEKLGLVKVSSLLGALIGSGVGAFGNRDYVYYDDDGGIAFPTTIEEANKLKRGLESRKRKLLRNTVQGFYTGSGTSLGAIATGIPSMLLADATGYMEPSLAFFLGGIPGALIGTRIGLNRSDRFRKMYMPLAKDHDKKIKEKEENKDNE